MQTALRVVLMLVASVTPAIAYRFESPALWALLGGGTGLAAGLAVFLLWQDALLKTALRREGFDFLVGIGLAGLLFYLVRIPLDRWIAPMEGGSITLRLCSLRGSVVPRAGAGAMHALTEWLRDGLCQGFSHLSQPRGGARTALVLGIACAEELAWRGGVQQALSEKLGSTRGWLAASALYVLAHAATGNLPLALLALACGLVWGGLYRYRGRLSSSLVSHMAFSYLLFGGALPVRVLH